MEPEHDSNASPRPWTSLRALKRALRLVPVWLPLTLAMFLLAAPLGAPRYSWFSRTLGSRYAPGDQVHHLSVDFRTDHAEGLRQLDAWSGDAAAFLGFLAMVLGVLAAGGWLQVLTGTGEGSILRRLAFGGARFFWRYSRLLIVSLLILGGWRMLVYGDVWRDLVLDQALEVPAWDRARLETLDSEALKYRLDWVQHGLFALLFGATLCWATYVRTRLALHDGYSVLVAGVLTLWMMLRHPVRTLRPMLGLLVVEALIVTGVLGLGARVLDARLLEGGGLPEVTGLFVLGLLALLVGELMRGAKYVAAVEVTRGLVKPVLRPDPWHTIGGPGGPQYPVDDEAEERYGVSL